MSDAVLEATDPYASHLPTIQFVLALVKPRRVLELGAGRYSTAAFLDFPTVEHLVTIETDEQWTPEPNPRLSLRLVEDTVEALPDDLTAFDLVFIDNGGEWSSEREPTIQAVLEGEHPVTVIHDAEYKPYYNLIEKLVGDDFRIFPPQPWTAVVW